MILALLEGKATPEQIAGLARGQAQRKIPQLIEALQGHRMNDHCALVIRSFLRHLGCLQEEIETVDDEILKQMQTPPFEAAFALLQTAWSRTPFACDNPGRDRNRFITISHA